MQFDFKIEHVAELLRIDANEWHDAIQRVLPKWNIDTVG